MPRSITVRIKPQPRLKVRFTEVEVDFNEDVVDLDSEPSAIIGRTAEAVAELLGCSYEEAERIVLGFTE